jgi:hypothetical protein
LECGGDLALRDDAELDTCRRKPPIGAGAPLLLRCVKCDARSSINAANKAAMQQKIDTMLALDDAAFATALVDGIDDDQRVDALRSAAPLFRAALASKDVLVNTSSPLPMPSASVAQLVIGKLRLCLMTHSYRHTFT